VVPSSLRSIAKSWMTFLFLPADPQWKWLRYSLHLTIQDSTDGEDRHSKVQRSYFEAREILLFRNESTVCFPQSQFSICEAIIWSVHAVSTDSRRVDNITEHAGAIIAEKITPDLSFTEERFHERLQTRFHFPLFLLTRMSRRKKMRKKSH